MLEIRLTKRGPTVGKMKNIILELPDRRKKELAIYFQYDKICHAYDNRTAHLSRVFTWVAHMSPK